MDTKLIEELKAKLEDEKKSLETELAGFAKEEKDEKEVREDSDKEEEADEAQEYDTMLSLEHSLESKLKDVNSALEKIQQGTYGKCEKCGNNIEEERLRAVPEARLCMKDNKK